MYGKRFAALFTCMALLMCSCSNGAVETTEEVPQAQPSVEATSVAVIPPEPTEITEQTEEEYPGIVDVTPPMILSAADSAKIDAGEYFDANNYISYIDDYDRNPVMTMETDVDTTVPGVYETAILITDRSGNVLRHPIKITVKGAGVDNSPTPTPNVTPTPKPPPQPSTIPFDKFVSEYGGAGRELGIDVSKWQGDVDYATVKAQGCSFVIIRAGVYYQGEFNFDSKFEQNLQNAKAAGLKVGLYFFTPVTSEAVLKENITTICEALHGAKLDFPIAYDMESWSRFQQYKINLQDLNGYFNTFCEVCESYGYSGMLYNSKNKLETVWNTDGIPVWLAHYTSQTNYEGDYILWQVNNIGRIPGIDGDVDLNVLYTDRLAAYQAGA
ncbi:Lyzozyme M1 (1,4-beta-N-acetylmuramidase), GH25 family [Ruminococcaceae bacterium YRB3002]|nr:Lyzozyme M1 (1,4-beta-N-acetylmuramidase), GH25 family [Ruminococcaceae bacterium YRB3002]